MRVAIIGGGAAGFFAALSCKKHHPKHEVIIFEKSPKVLQKVKISGGGRCNFANSCFDIAELSENYPRGGKQLKKSFGFFSTKDTLEWFNSRGVDHYVQEDNCIFPKSDDSQTIIDCFLKEAKELGVEVKTKHKVEELRKNKAGEFEIQFEDLEAEFFDKVIITTGGSPKMVGLEWLEKLGLKIESPVPSLFTFNMPGNPITELMGIVVNPATVKISGTKLKADGPLLITHWGMSGPAILKLSAFGARILNDFDYNFEIQVNWLHTTNEEEHRDLLNSFVEDNPKKKIANVNPFKLQSRLWEFLLKKAEIDIDMMCADLGKKRLNVLLNLLMNDTYKVSGKTTFKEEFVTCGGVCLSEINMKTMQSEKRKDLYFAGEVLDIDGVTGGFNFQAAWTTGFVAGQLKD